jgi:hypothetical protein
MINQVLLLFSLFFVIALVLFGIYLSKVEGAGKKKWILLLYMLIVGVLIAAASKLGFYEFAMLPLWFFMVAQFWLLAVGTLHAWLFDKFIPLEHKSLGKIFFTLAVCAFGYGLFIMAFKVYYHAPFPRLYFLPGFFFLAPTFVLIAFNYFIKIPSKVYLAWDFPAPGTLPDPKDSEMAEPIIINFEIRKSLEDNRTVFKAKAPKAMDLGKLFYFFINDYNSRNPNNPILISDSENKRFKWTFYQSGNIFQGKKYLDPEITIAENRIKENASIICERINL